MKSMIMLVIFSMSVVAGADNRINKPVPRESRDELQRVAQDIQDSLARRSQYLSEDERRDVRRLLIDALGRINGEDMSGPRPPHGPKHGRWTRPVPLFCTDSNSNKLMNADTQLIYDFDDPVSCANAAATASRDGLFCTDANSNKLFDTSGKMIYDFDDPTECANAIPSIARGGRFCTKDSNKLMDSTGKMIHDFDNPEDCAKARDIGQ